MMTLSQQSFERAKEFIYKHARLIDRRRFEYFFDDGTKEAVLSALRAYQNDDGGFGNALEPDIRCPDSQPVPLEVALHMMDELNEFDSQILSGIARYLSEASIPETGGFPLAFKSINDYPRAPWWDTQQDHIASINPTGSVIGLLLKQQVNLEMKNEPWFTRAIDFIHDTFQSSEPEGYHDGIHWVVFLENVIGNTPFSMTKEGKSLYAEAKKKIDVWLSKPETIEKDPNASGYVHKVLDWAPTPDAYAAKFVKKDDVQLHLEHLAEKQNEDGGWPISWPTVSPAVELEWRGNVTVNSLLTFRAYGWL